MRLMASGTREDLVAFRQIQCDKVLYVIQLDSSGAVGGYSPGLQKESSPLLTVKSAVGPGVRVSLAEPLGSWS
jgi:hypothetical protein